MIRVTQMFAYPTVVISVFAFVFFQYWWICSLLTMEPAAYATYKLQIQGLFFLGLIVGTVFAEIFFSGRLSDWLMLRLAKRNNGLRLPEMRLWLGYPAAVLSSLGLLLWGLSVDREWHWITGQIAFFLCKHVHLLWRRDMLIFFWYRWSRSANWQYSALELYRR
jgi:hypothetical protein